MKKLSLLLLMMFAVNSFGQIINFPDPNFKAKLLQPGVAWDFIMESGITIDANNDGEIEVDEIQSVSNLNVSNANITDLTGISYFTNLKWLNCSHNALQNIVIDPNIALIELNASYNQLSTLEVHYDYSGEYDYPTVNLSHNSLTTWAITSGRYLSYDLRYNQLHSLTLGATIDFITASYNPLTILDLNNSYIKSLNVSYTALSSITGSGTLKQANFQNCQFTLLDLTHVSFYYSYHAGSWIYLGNNPEDRVIFGEYSPDNISYSSSSTFFDLANFRGGNSCNPDDPYWEGGGKINIVDCPNLNFLSMKNGVVYKDVNCSIPITGETWTQTTLLLTITNCPSLSFMCVDEDEREYVQAKINALGLQNQVQVNSYCTFTPGGTYYTLGGTSRLDANANGCDASDPLIPFQEFLITNGTQSQVVSANEIGDYQINVGEGSHTISPILENPEYYTVFPAFLTLNFPTDTSPVQQHFCIMANQSHPDLEISVLPITIARPGFDAIYKISYKNKGTQPQSGNVSLAYDDAVLDFVDAAPIVSFQTVNSLQWNFTDLHPFETRSVLVTFNAHTPMEIPPVNGGDIFTFTAAINSALLDETPADNTFTLSQTVVNSFDPNDKTCLEGNRIAPEMVGKEVHYMIRFENTGTAHAENIVVKDMIDTAKFDINSLVPMGASHSFVTKISHTNQVEFIFENINLPFEDASNDGYVIFKIKTLPTLALGDTFSNTASIYFDYNFPIITNTASATVALLADADFDFAAYFKIYPVPVTNQLNLEMKKSIEVTSINIYNTLGQLVLIIPNAQQTKSVDVSSLKSGNYFVKINSSQGHSTAKFMKI